MPHFKLRCVLADLIYKNVVYVRFYLIGDSLLLVMAATSLLSVWNVGGVVQGGFCCERNKENLGHSDPDEHCQ